jgi:hypothetical protein
MGASLQTVTFHTDDRKAIATEWDGMVSQDLHENGHSYSGGIGMLGSRIAKWVDKQFTNRDDADEYIADNQEKWEPAMAVSFIEKDKKCWLIGGWCSE